MLEGKHKIEVRGSTLDFILLQSCCSAHTLFTVYPHVLLPCSYDFLSLLRGSTQTLSLWGYDPPQKGGVAVDSKIQTPEREDSHSSEMPSDAQPQSDYYTQSLWYKSADEFI